MSGSTFLSQPASSNCFRYQTRLAKLGVKRINIAKKYGYTSTSSITRILKLNNIEILSPTKMSQNKIINNKDFIIKSYKDGSTLLDIGRAVKVDPMKISEILQENNVKLVNRS